MRRPSPRIYPVALGILAVTFLASGLGSARPASEWKGEAKSFGTERLPVPEDRYAMAGGCYVIRSADAGYLARDAGGFVASAETATAAEPFFFQATALGKYLLYGTAEDFLAASEGAIGEAAYTVTESDPGATAGGVLLEQTDRAADELARSDANRAAGRGESVVAADAPSDLADWEIAQISEGTFTLSLPETEQALAANGSALELVDAGSGTAFSFELASGCTDYPEIDVNVSGSVTGGKSSFQEARGYFDGHLHMMAFEFLGGRARCGRPWHRFGVTHALVDCPDHKPEGHGAILEQFLSGDSPGTGHNTDGWPTFAGWPRHDSLTHEQIYYKWMERAWRGGLRMFTNLLVDNNQLCKIYPYKRNSCNEMDGVRLQAQRIRELQDYIDAQSGGPGEGWFRIVENPFDARRVINEGKLAVVLGIEVSVPLDCGLTLDMPRCNTDQIDERLDEVYDLGVRQMELINKFDNAFAGVAGDAGDTGLVVNQGNFLETGSYWRMDTCDEPEGHETTGHAHDRTQHNFHDSSGAPDEFTGRDALAGGILALAGTSGRAPIYPEGPHCNILGLSELGEHMIRGLAQRGMIFDPDHMSALAQRQALDLVETLEHPGVISSHGWSNDTIYPRIYELGGIITPYAGGSEGFVEEWRQHREWKDDRYYFGFGYGADTNGFGSQGGPRGHGAPNQVTYPFTGFGGVTVAQQQSGTRTYDINTDGVAHYGLYPDWLQDLRQLAGDAIIEDMERGAEAYLQMWERAIGIAPDSCRTDVPDLTEAELDSLQRGMAWDEVLETLGQPVERTDTTFTYCVENQREATVRFDAGGTVNSWNSHAAPHRT